MGKHRILIEVDTEADRFDVICECAPNHTWVRHFDKLDKALQAELTLKRIWTLVDD